MNVSPASRQARGERRVLGEESVAGMHRIRTRSPRRVEDRLDPQVALATASLGADVDRLVGFAHVRARRDRSPSRRRPSASPSRGTRG